mgnify:CR=1 FL=1
MQAHWHVAQPDIRPKPAKELVCFADKDFADT